MRLKVNDIILDQFENTIIAQTFGVNEFGSLETRQGGLSNDFTLPLTQNNKIALDFPDDLNFVTRKPYEKVDAQLIDVGTVVAIGYLRYKIVTNNTEISCSFFSDNTEWFNLIKDKKMSELDLSDYDHDWTYTNIINAINANKSSGYTYPLIDYGFFKDKATFDADQNQVFPAMFVSSLVEQVYKDIGWSVSGSLLSDSIYQRMIQPFSAKDFVHSKEYISNNTLEDTENGTPSFLFGDLPSVVWDTFGTDINVPVASTYLVTVTLEGEYTIGSNAVLVDIRKNTTSQGTGIFGVGDSGPNSATFQVEVKAGVLDDIDVQVSVTANVPGFATILSGNITIEPVSAISFDEEIQISSTMPDITQTDFLRYIFFTFGIVPQPNNYSKNVDLDLFNNIKDNIPNAIDWSGKIDLSKDYSNDYTKLLDNYSRRSRLTYLEDDQDEELDSYLAETEQIFGQGFINIDNEHLDPEKDVYEAPYSSMINIISFDDSIYIPQIKYYAEDTDNPGTFLKEFKPFPKIAILTENISVEALTYSKYSVFKINPLTVGFPPDLPEIPFCWFAKTQYISEVDSFDWSLAYDPVLFPNNIGAGMKETYIQDYVDILSNMKFIKAYFKLNEVDTANLDFMTPVYIDRFKSYFYINKIEDYQGSNKSTQVELIKIS